VRAVLHGASIARTACSKSDADSDDTAGRVGLVLCGSSGGARETAPLVEHAIVAGGSTYRAMRTAATADRRSSACACRARSADATSAARPFDELARAPQQQVGAAEIRRAYSSASTSCS
jgi:hypothetical protein